MDKLFQTVSSTLVAKDKKVQIYTSLNQHLVNNPDVVLWDKSAASISTDIYQKFKEAITKRTCNWYTISKILPYQDFCIALLCSVGYSLNHNTVPIVTSRTFKSAWRSMSILIGIGDKDLQDWIKDRIQDRDSNKYCIALDISEPDSPTMSRKVSFNTHSRQLSVDENIILKACSSRKIVEITPDSSENVSSVFSKVTGTPEGQLDNLRIIHKYF